MGVRTLCLIQ